MNDKVTQEKHVGALLSGYLDGELTQQEEQKVRLHCEACVDCSRELDELATTRERLGQARLSGLDRDRWRESMNDTTVNATKGVGWLLFIGGIILAAGIGVVAFLTGPQISAMERLIIGGIYGGLLLLFISVLRQRLIERKSDKYKDVEI